MEERNIEIEEIIRTGNIRRDRSALSESPYAANAMYMGSGDFGGCFDLYGMAPNGFMHGDFYHHGVYGMDFYTKPFRLTMENFSPEELTQHSQYLDLFDGVLTTQMKSHLWTLTIRASFHPYKRDLLALEFTWQGEKLPRPVLSGMGEYGLDYGQKICGSLRYQGENRYESSNGTGSGLLMLKTVGEAALHFGADRAEMVLPDQEGKACLFMAVSGKERFREAGEELESAGDSTFFEETAEAWHKRWGKSRIVFQEKELLQLFYRGVWHILCSHGPSSRFIAPPMGWSGAAWAFHFPQDFVYITPVLMKLGHMDIVKAKIEMYNHFIPAVRDYTRRIYGADGTMWCWGFPIGDGKDLFADGRTPNVYAYEIHNAAFPARLAWEAAQFLQDRDWSRNYVWPIIRGSAEFYLSVLKKEGATWGIEVRPSMSQDEYAGPNKKNYLCALYAAKYTLKTFIEAAGYFGIKDELLPKAVGILADGLAFERLIHPGQELYMNYETEPDSYQFGQMMLPVPLNPISFYPLGELDRYEENAYRRRFDLCRDSREHIFYGWTLADMILASAHMGDSEGFWELIREMEPSDYVEKDWLYVYETSGSFEKAPYITSEGLICDAILCGIGCDFWGRLQTDGVHFEGLGYRNLTLASGKLPDR